MPSPSRVIAYEVLLRVERDGAYANVALEAALSNHPGLDPRDSALASELVHGVLRRQMALDAAVEHAAERALDRLELPVRILLRLGSYQLIYLDRVPARAAVHETVEIAKDTGLSRAAGLTNAVLRRVAREPLVPLPEDPLAKISVQESHPLWLVRRWATRLGLEQARELCHANNQPAPLCLRVNLTTTRREELLDRLRAAHPEGEIGPGHFATTAVTVRGAGAPTLFPGHAEGHFQVQDEAAQLVGRFTGHRAGPALDVCAAPGGKACHLAELSLSSQPRGEILAVDISWHKLRRVTAEALRLRLPNVRCLAADARSVMPVKPRSQHAVLVDAPCSGLGTLRRHPELRYRRTEEDLSRLGALQWQILGNAAESVSPGGLLTYAVCSGEPEEWRSHRERFLREHGDFEAAPPLPPGDLGSHDAAVLASPEATFESWPHRHGLDGFAAFRLRRRA
jgi:16S rRNA (cytosine967-C5)-methyltransferase